MKRLYKEELQLHGEKLNKRDYTIQKKNYKEKNYTERDYTIQRGD